MLPETQTFDQLGGTLRNYAPVEDPSTDLDAAFDNATRANVAAMTAVVPRARVIIQTSEFTPLVLGHTAVWGSAPAVAPTVAPVSSTRCTVTFPETITDDLGEVHTINLVASIAGIRALTSVASYVSGARTVEILAAAGNVVDLLVF